MTIALAMRIEGPWYCPSAIYIPPTLLGIFFEILILGHLLKDLLPDGAKPSLSAFPHSADNHTLDKSTISV